MSAMRNIEAADRLLCLDEVKVVAGIGKSMIYRKMRAGTFPKACKAGGSSTRWSEREVQEWIALQLSSRQAA
ncbi:AlpA family transcriptional regulator [Sphingomonas sp. S6]|jgi:prophage regulatory protein|uniref:helix-turn-helix transcriptional regulator n=1 Tax=Sphingomonas sp. S6 TaxID=3368600 RepID=UPI000F96E5FD|nr:AlpA family phage regulatory protein [uncultured Sphingomonas sp.]RTL18572.1 MAG: AlpA family phage regulatory protein [Sphingomonadaceae bacterium]